MPADGRQDGEEGQDDAVEGPDDDQVLLLATTRGPVQDGPKRQEAQPNRQEPAVEEGRHQQLHAGQEDRDPHQVHLA